MVRGEKKVICITTTSPTGSITPSGGGGSLVILCPYTGSILSSLLVQGEMGAKEPIGFMSVSDFPSLFSRKSCTLAMGCGMTTKRDDTYGVLVTLRTSLAPTVHWKCRLPEPQLSGGLLVSSCGRYVIGGSATGSIYVWASIRGTLIRSFKAHYRPVKAMTWSSERLLVTGGADGMIHTFSLLDLVDNTDSTSPSGSQSIQPIQSWTKHSLEVTAVLSLDASRVASCGEDGLLVLMEVFSGTTLAQLRFPVALRVLCEKNGHIFAGDATGLIHIVDVDFYAARLSKEMAVQVEQHRIPATSLRQQLFETPGDHEDSSVTGELRGHERAITSLAVIEADDESGDLLVSGDELGELRIWDLHTCTCIRVLYPWSHSLLGRKASEEKLAGERRQESLHPVTRILVLSTGSQLDNMPQDGFVSQRERFEPMALNLITPLQKYSVDQDIRVPVPFLRPHRSDVSSSFWHLTASTHLSKLRMVQQRNKRTKRTKIAGDGVFNSNAADEISRLKLELEAAKVTIGRWEAVNNKLMAKLQQDGDI